jgi:NADPH-dependent stearoyl-CoA 9-desaturase
VSPVLAFNSASAPRLAATSKSTSEQAKENVMNAYGLSSEAQEAFGKEIDQIQSEIRATLGERDRAYILRMISIQRGLAFGGRAAIFASLPLLPTGIPFAVVLGAGAFTLGIAKILENMEIGHNVIHGQWDWMNDPAIHSATWEWDNVCPAAQWKHSHNFMHHTWTNVMGKDHDVGYQIMRVSDRQEWKPAFLFQPVYNMALAALFEWGIAMHDLDFEAIRTGKKPISEVKPLLAQIAKKAARQLAKDYLLWPLLAGPFFLWVAGANLVANLMRNVWSYAIIFCGHFPDGVRVFAESEIEGETHGGWCVRQVLGSCNIDGGPLFHVMSGNLSFQIEHHLFPDLPSNRYAEAAPRVKALCAKYGIPYNTGSFSRQLGTTLRTIFRLAWPSSRTTREGAEVTA